MSKQVITVSAVDPIQFVKRMLEMGAKGATLRDGTFPRIKGVPYMVQLEIETDKNTEVAPAPGVTPTPIPLQEKVYTREELDGMSWDEFRKNTQAHGVKGRQRDVMTVQYLKATGQSTDLPSENKEE